MVILILWSFKISLSDQVLVLPMWVPFISQVVLLQWPSCSQVNYYVLPDVAAISRAIQETNPCTQTVFFLTWGKRDGDHVNCNVHESFCSFEGIQARRGFYKLDNIWAGCAGQCVQGLLRDGLLRPAGQRSPGG